MLRHLVLVGVLAAALVTIAFVYFSPAQDARVHVGWMTTIQGQGQTVEALKSGDILDRQELDVAWVPFLIGPPMIEAALANRLEIIAAAAQPTIALTSRSSDWRIVARRNTLRHSIIVPPSSPFKSLRDLKGKKIGVAIGTNVEIYLIKAIQAEGLKTIDFNIVNVAPPEDAELIGAGSDRSWGDFAAFVVWDPVLAQLEESGKARAIGRTMMPFYVSIRGSLEKRAPGTVARYVCALREAWLAYARDPSRYDKAYRADVGVDVDEKTFSTIDGIEPNMHAKTLDQIDVQITPELIQDLKNTAAIMKELKRLPQTFDVMTVVDGSISRSAPCGPSRRWAP